MARRYTGGFISATEQVTDSNTSNGVFSLAEAQEKTALGNFPTGRWTPSRSLRFRSAASTYLTKTYASAGNQQKWTWSFWVKRGKLGDGPQLFSSAGPNHVGGADIAYNGFDGSDRFIVYMYPNGGPAAVSVSTTRVFRDPSAWYHIVVQYDTTQTISTDRVRIYVNGSLETSFANTTYPSQNYSGNYINSTRQQVIGQEDARWRYPFDGYLTEWYFLDGISLDASYFGQTDPETDVWVPKKYTGAFGTNGYYLPFSNNGSTTALGLDMSTSKNMVTYSEQLDNAAWVKGNATVTVNAVNDPLNATLTADKIIPTSTNGYHTLYQGATVQPSTYYTMSFYAKTAGYGRIQMGDSNTVGGGAYFDLNTGSLYGQTTSNDQSLYDLSANIQSVGSGWYRCSVTFKTGSAQSGINQFLYIVKNDGTTSYAGDTTSGVYLWGMQVNVGKSANTYVTTTTAAIQNDFTTNNFSVTAGTTYDSMVDVPGIPAVSPLKDIGGVVRGNYATFNRLQSGSGTASSYAAFNSGNMLMTGQTNVHNLGVSTIGLTSGKWYWEGHLVTVGNSNDDFSVGIIDDSGVKDYNVYSGYKLANRSADWGWYSVIGGNGTYNQVYSAFTWTAGDVLGCAIDFDNNEVRMWRNGTLIFTSNVVNLVGKVWYPYIQNWSTSSRTPYDGAINFGQRPFVYTPPDGFKSICSTNLPNPVIKRPSDHFDIKTYVGNGTIQSIGAVNKQASNYIINRSLRTRSSGTANMVRTPSTVGNRRTWTVSMWVKHGSPATQQPFFNSVNTAASSHGTIARTYDNRNIQFGDYNNGWTWQLITNTCFIDTKQWHHYVFSVDTTQATPQNRVKIYVDGVLQSSFSTASYPSQNYDTYVNYTSAQCIGANQWAGSYSAYTDAEFAEINWIDGQQLGADSFGQFDGNNNWMPKAYTGTYGTNGLYLPFGTRKDSVNYSGIFNGSSAYIDCGNHQTNWDFGSGDFTIEGWFNPTTWPTRHMPAIQKGHPTNNNQYDWRLYFGDTTVNNTQIWFDSNIGSTASLGSNAQNVYPYSWNHVAVVRSGSNLYIYLNGKRIQSVAASGTMSNTYTNVYIGIENIGAAGQSYFNGYMHDVRIVKGTAIYTGATYTMPTSNLTAVSGTQLLTLQNSTAIDNSSNAWTLTNTSVTLKDFTPFDLIDRSGNGNNICTINTNFYDNTTLSYDLLLDTPIEYDDGSGNIRGNYSTFNTSIAFAGHNSSYNLDGGPTFSHAGTRVYRTQNDNRAFGTLGMSSGKWYWEFTIEGHTRTSIGIADTSNLCRSPSAGNEYASNGLYGLVTESGQTLFANNVLTSVSYLSTVFAVNDVIGIAFDADNGELYISKNGTWGYSGNPATRTNPLVKVPKAEYTAFWAGGGDYPSSATLQGTINFGQRPLVYTPPSGFKTLNTKNLKDTGSYKLPNTFGNLVNTPDLVWIKNRSNSAGNNGLYDTSRGPNFDLRSDQLAFSNYYTGYGVQQFNPNGVTVAGNGNVSNSTNESFVAWMWNKGKVPGFDIIEYSGDGSAAGTRNVPHNLGVTPAFIVIRNIHGSVAGHWIVQHKSLGISASPNSFNLGNYQSCVLWTSTSGPITYGYDRQVNDPAYSYIAYLWAEVPGFSKFGNYYGNGSTDGAFINTGFAPKYIMFKWVSGAGRSAGYWYIYDTVRQNGYQLTKELYVNDPAAEYTAATVTLDVVSNGFKMRSASTDMNGSGGNFIYAAFAENPFKYATAR